jgi:hypothetical protein
MLFIKKLFKREEKVPLDHLVEQHSLLIKAARRCAYDLRHCIQEIPESNYKYSSPEWWGERANMWVDIFTEDGAKNYRHKLHSEIFKMECEVNRLEKLLDANNIEHKKDIPF